MQINTSMPFFRGFHNINDDLGHCLEGLRQALTCHVDYSLDSLEWEAQVPEKLAMKVTAPRACVR